MKKLIAIYRQLNRLAEKPWQRLLWNLGGALMGGLLTTLAVAIATAQDLSQVLGLLDGHTEIVLWNTLFIALLSLGLGLAMKRLSRGFLVTAGFAMGFTIANHFKTLITATPLELYELSLIGRLGAITRLNADSLTISLATALSVLIPLLWFAALRVFAKPLLDMDWRWSLSAAGGSLGAFTLVFLLLADPLVYAPASVSLDLRVTQGKVYDQCFVPLGLWRSILYQGSAVGTDDPFVMAGILTQIDEILEEEPPGGPAGEEAVRPNVILILSESFFDVTALPGVEFQEDPLAEYHALLEESVSGKFYSRSLGYGTCNVELEVFTGINSQLLEYGDDPLGWDPEELAVLSPVPGQLREAGYYTAYLHMFNDDIYKRTELFAHMGFDEMFFSPDMGYIDPDAPMEEDAFWEYMAEHISGSCYSDSFMTELIVHLFEQREAEGPVFINAVSMENHSPYEGDKYEGYDYPFTTEAPLSEDGMGALNAFVQGASNTSKALKELTGYFAGVDEPTVIIFYGDHRPGLGLESGESVYSELGMYEGSVYSADPQTVAEVYAADYLIWANDPSLLPAPVGTRTADTSPVFLGLEVLEAANVELTRYWRLVELMEEVYTAYNSFYFLSPEGEASQTIPEGIDQTVLTWMAHVLDDARNLQYITGYMNQTP